MQKIGRCGDPPEVRNTNPDLVAPDPPVMIPPHLPPLSFSLQNRSDLAAANSYDASDDSQLSVASVESNATELSFSTAFKDALMFHKEDLEVKSCSTAYIHVLLMWHIPTVIAMVANVVTVALSMVVTIAWP